MSAALPTDRRSLLLGLPPVLPCLSLDQPFAGLCAAKDDRAPLEEPGLKSLETRPWRWPSTRPIPAPVVICASQKRRMRAMREAMPRVDERFRPLLGLHGVALCLAWVVGCRPLVQEDAPLSWWWEPDEAAKRPRFAFQLSHVLRLGPLPVSGLQGLARTVHTSDVLDALERRIPLLSLSSSP